MEENTKINDGASEVILSWEARQFENVPRHRGWYVVLFIMLVVLLAYGLFTDNFLLGIIVILVGLLFYLFEKRESQTFKFSITTEGVRAHNSIHEFSSIEDFWIFYEPAGRKELSIRSSKKLMPYVHLPLGNANPLDVREALLQFIPEIEHEESLVDSLERFI